MTIDNEIINLRRYFHSYPELSKEEFKTADFIETYLKSLKIPTKRLAKTGVIGLLKGSKAGKTIALRADIDALPIQEENNVAYKSKNAGIMHACGHDAHIALMLGAANLLSQKKANLKGNVKFIFQPSEELSGGARALVKEGIMKNPKVDIVLGAHVTNEIPSGAIGIKFGAMMASVDRIHIYITGLMAHGAYPNLGKDALIAAASFIMSAQTIISREINPIEPAVLTLGKITGGDNYNVIAQNVRIDGTVRTLNKEVRKHIKESILQKLKSIEISYGVKCKIDYIDNAQILINNKVIAQFCQKTAQDFYGKDNVKIIENPVMGGEDFSEYLDFAPGNYLNIGTGKGQSAAFHHSHFTIDEAALPKASKYIVYTVEKLLNAEDLSL
jgi:amidohydrolase